MNSLLKYDPIYRINKNWVSKFRSFLLNKTYLRYEAKGEMVLIYKNKQWILCDNCLEFNLTMINTFDHPSIPYVKNKKAVDPEALALHILEIIEEDYKVVQFAKNGTKAIDAVLENDDASYIDDFLNQTRNNYEN